ncbi:hypothetical protein BGX28_007705 [Mortierella sp. GBA30]|nr:hypothetical protein BGX28_007705 [Mortierella sp. GBA30]
MADASKDFRVVFDAEKQSIEEGIAGLERLPKNELPSVIDTLVQRIHALEKTVTEKISILPPYDARICIEAIKAMSEQLNQSRTKLIPKAKFSFKSRKTASSSSSSPATVSPTPSGTMTPKPTESPKSISMTDESQFMRFENKTGEHLFIGTLEVQTVSGTEGRVTSAKDVALTNLTDCTINLVHDVPLGAIHIKNLTRCTLVLPPVSGSILLHDCEGCTLIGACHQSRMHTSKNMDIYLHVTSEPIIEDCSDMRFAPYGQVLPAEQLDRLFEIAQLNPAKNYFDKVKDFNWLRQQQSPNWRLLEDSEIKPEIASSVLARDS